MKFVETNPRSKLAKSCSFIWVDRCAAVSPGEAAGTFSLPKVRLPALLPAAFSFFW